MTPHNKWNEINRALGRALTVWGRARYLSVTEAPHNTDFHTWMEKKHFFVFFKLPRPGVKGSGANHYPRAPAHAA